MLVRFGINSSWLISFRRKYLEEKAAQKMLEIALTVARPKVVYEVSKVTNQNKDSVVIGGVRFTSSLLRINLDKVDRVFPIDYEILGYPKIF